MKRLVILGSTGSIGKNTLDVARRFPGKFRIAGLSAYSNVDELKIQAREFRPEVISVGDARLVSKLKSKISSSIRVFGGSEGLKELARAKCADTVVVAITGAQALEPLLLAVEAGKDIVLANKEALVMAGPLVMRKVRKHGVSLRPVDSEQSAIWQCLDKQDKLDLKTIYLTASGGPMLNVSKEALSKVSVRQVLDHPRWKMGKKISVDSATLMNKGLEVLEAMYLFGVGPRTIKVVIHPEAIVHSMVEFIDGVIMAQLSATDMRIPIQYALTYPERLSGGPLPGVDFLKLGKLEFKEPDFKKFPCLRLAYAAASKEGTAPCVLNAANEVAVDAFLGGNIPFTGIAGVVEKVLSRQRNIASPALCDIFNQDAWAREEALRSI